VYITITNYAANIEGTYMIFTQYTSTGKEKGLFSQGLRFSSYHLIWVLPGSLTYLIVQRCSNGPLSRPISLPNSSEEYTTNVLVLTIQLFFAI